MHRIHEEIEPVLGLVEELWKEYKVRIVIKFRFDMYASQTDLVRLDKLGF